MRWRIDGSICKPRMAAGEIHWSSDDSLLDRSSPRTGLAVKTIENSCRTSLLLGVADHVAGVGVDPNHAGDFAGDPGFLLGLAHCRFGDRLAEVHAAAGDCLTAQRPRRASPGHTDHSRARAHLDHSVDLHPRGRGSPPRGPSAAQQSSRRRGMSRYCGQPWWSTAGFKILAGSFSQVELGGLEPPTPCLQSRCSSS